MITVLKRKKISVILGLICICVVIILAVILKNHSQKTQKDKENHINQEMDTEETEKQDIDEEASGLLIAEPDEPDKSVDFIEPDEEKNDTGGKSDSEKDGDDTKFGEIY